MTFREREAAKGVDFPMGVLLGLPFFVVVQVFRFFEYAFLFFMAAGCLPFLHPWATDRAVGGAYDQTFQATFEVLEREGFPIEEVDREAGRIVTGKRSVSGVDFSRSVETVRAEIEEAGDEETSVRLFLTFVEPAPPETSTSSSRKSGAYRSSEAAGQAISKSAVYDDYLDAIEDRVRALRGEDDS